MPLAVTPDRPVLATSAATDVRRRGAARVVRAAVVVVAGWLLLAGSTTSASADPYSPAVVTDISIKVVVAEPGRPVTFSVEVRANTTAARPSGTLRLKMTSGPRWTATAPYDGRTAVVRGPVLRRGTYRLVVEFVPNDPDQFRGATEALRFHVGHSSPQPPSDEPDQHQLLPDTGGPWAGWLLLGSALVVGGAACVGVDRRRRRASAGGFGPVPSAGS